MNQLLDQFLNESRDNLAYIDENLESLKEENADIDALFRAAHTLKGGAGLVGFESVQELTHTAEDILDKLRHGEIQYSEKMVEVLFDIFDEVVELIDQSEETGDIVAKNQQVIDALSDKAGEILKAKDKEDPKEQTVDTPLQIYPDKPKALEQFSKKTMQDLYEQLPPAINKIDQAFLHHENFYFMDFDLDVDTIMLGNDPFYLLSLFEDALKAIRIDIPKSCEELDRNPLQWASRIFAIVHSDEETIEGVCENILDEIAIYPLSQEMMQDTRSGDNPNKKQPSTKTPGLGKKVKIDQFQIDNLMDNIGELLVMKNSMPYIVKNLNEDTLEQSKRDILSKYDQISRITSQLQETVMAMRLLPLSYILSRYPKLVRDLSKKLDKKIKYEEDGGDTKLDKTMIEHLADPMVHLIRNSIDHGIEDSRTREEKGKDPKGTISIKAMSQGDKVMIEISDDGGGIDADKIAEKAVENQLVTGQKVDEMSKEEIIGLIFHSGLTTKEQISDLSGRGVGMDAVKNAIEGLNGRIGVESELNKGTTIWLELPVSVALTNVFHIKMNNTDYAIAMDYLIETSHVEKSDIQESNKKPFLYRRGELLPLLYPQALVSREAKDRQLQKVVVLQTGDKRFALGVDAFVNQLDVVQKPLTGALKKHPIISGSSLLGNGNVLFILDVNKVANIPSWV